MSTKQDWQTHARAQEHRFWSHVDRRPGACWIWTACVDKDGYGKFSVSLPRLNGRQQQKHIRAHRLSLFFAGREAGPAELVLHSCDTPGCCNPDHLSAGTQKQNRVDAVARGRVPRGERHPMVKLTERQAVEIIRRRDAGENMAAVARELGIPKGTIHGIGRVNWKHLRKGAA